MIGAVDTRLLFIGECRSLTAKRKNWTWKDGRLAAKPLFEALEALGVDPAAHEYINLWTDSAPPCIPWQRVQRLVRAAEEGVALVALGQKVSVQLTKRGIDHVALVHPAARGKIRKRERYHAHVAEKLAPVMQKVLRIRGTHDEPGASWIERYFLRDRKGVFRELKKIPGNHQYAPGYDEILAWFEQLGVTHVEVAPGWHDAVLPKTYVLATFARHMRRIEIESES